MERGEQRKFELTKIERQIGGKSGREREGDTKKPKETV